MQGAVFNALQAGGTVVWYSEYGGGDVSRSGQRRVFPMLRYLYTCSIIFALLGGAWSHGAEPAVPGVVADIPRPAQAAYETRADHDPNGIGKFFMGREIARVMGHSTAGVAWLERPERIQEEEPDRMLAALPLRPGMTVADIGAGSGYFSFRLSQKVGPTGKVLAVDIQQEMLDEIRDRMKKVNVNNVVPVLGTIEDPQLPPGSTDLILMVDVYHEFSHPWEMTRGMVRGLAPGGKIVFVEYRLEDPEVPIKLVHKMTEKQVKREMAVHPEMKFSKTLRTLPWQHVVIFEKK